MNVAKRYVASPVVSCGDEGDEGAILFNPDTDDALVVNPTGKAIWQFLSTPHTADQIVTHLLDVFQGAAEEEIARDVAQFIEDLSSGFIQEAEDHAV